MKICVIGDLVLEHDWYGQAHGLVPSSHAPLLHHQQDHWSAGGAAKMAQALSERYDVTLVGMIGSDAPAQQLLSLLEHGPYRTKLHRHPQGTTPLLTRIWAHQVFRPCVAATYSGSKEAERCFYEHQVVMQQLKGCCWSTMIAMGLRRRPGLT